MYELPCLYTWGTVCVAGGMHVCEKKRPYGQEHGGGHECVCGENKER